MINITGANNTLTPHSSKTQEFAKPRTPVSEGNRQENYDKANEIRPSILSATVQHKSSEYSNALSTDQSYTVDSKLFQGTIEDFVLV